MRYPMIMVHNPEGGLTVIFRGFPEAITYGETYTKAVAQARDALMCAFEMRVEAGGLIPMPKAGEFDETFLFIPASLSAKIMLINAMINARVSKSELARRLGVSPQQVTRIVSLRHATKIDTLEQALTCLGKELWLYTCCNTL